MQDQEKIMKPSTAATIAQYIRTYLHIYKYLFRLLEKVTFCENDIVFTRANT